MTAMRAVHRHEVHKTILNKTYIYLYISSSYTSMKLFRKNETNEKLKSYIVPYTAGQQEAVSPTPTCPDRRIKTADSLPNPTESRGHRKPTRRSRARPRCPTTDPHPRQARNRRIAAEPSCSPT